MVQPGSLRDASVSFATSAATSASCPALAIQVTANTTIASFLLSETRAPSVSLSVEGVTLASPSRLRQRFPEARRSRLQFRHKLIFENRMAAIRPSRNHPNLSVRFLLHKFQILLRGFRQLIETGNALGRSLPSRHLAVETLNLVVVAGLRRNLLRFLAVDLVPDAQRNFREFVQHVQLRHHQPGNAIYHASVTQQWQVQPSSAPGTACNRPLFIASLAQLLTQRARFFAWKRSFAHSRAISLGQANHRINRIRGDSRADGSATRSGVRRRHKRISAVVDIEHRSLRAFKQNRLPRFQRLIQKQRRVAHKRRDLLRR